MREFESGATRDSDEGKPDYEAYLSPRVIVRFGEYMLKHQNTPLGKREGDNWQKGFGRPVIMKSLWRHVVDVWQGHRGTASVDLEEALCATIFNAQAYLHDVLVHKAVEKAVEYGQAEADKDVKGMFPPAAQGLVQPGDYYTTNPYDNKLGLQTGAQADPQLVRDFNKDFFNRKPGEYVAIPTPEGIRIQKVYADTLPVPIPNTEPCEQPPITPLSHARKEALREINKEAQRVQGEPDPLWPSPEYQERAREWSRNHPKWGNHE